MTCSPETVGDHTRRLIDLERDRDATRAALDGNGQTGIKTRIAILEADVRAIKFVAWKLAGACLAGGAATQALIELLKKANHP
jgi:hypothetical protein